MRLECNLFVALRRLNGDSRCGRQSRGFLGLGKSEKSYYLLVQHRSKKSEKFNLNKTSVHRVISNHVKDGKATVMLSDPDVTIFVADANPKKLFTFIESIQDFIKTNTIEDRYCLQTWEANSSQAEIAATQQRRMHITCRAEYPRGSDFPPFLEELKMIQIGLKSIDFRWFSLRHLKLLDLSKNSLGNFMKGIDWRKFLCIQRLERLEKLNLSENDFGTLSEEFYDALPASLISLNLSSNKIAMLPEKIGRLRNLNFLSLNNNDLLEIPEDLVLLDKLQTLNISSNFLIRLPGVMFSRKTRYRLYHLDLSGNERLFQPEYPRRLFTFATVPFLYQIAAAVLLNKFSKFQTTNCENVLPKVVHLEMRTYLQRCTACLNLFPRSNSETTSSNFERIVLGSYAELYSGPAVTSVQRFFCPRCAFYN